MVSQRLRNNSLVEAPLWHVSRVIPYNAAPLPEYRKCITSLKLGLQWCQWTSWPIKFWKSKGCSQLYLDCIHSHHTQEVSVSLKTGLTISVSFLIAMQKSSNDRFSLYIGAWWCQWRIQCLKLLTGRWSEKHSKGSYPPPPSWRLITGMSVRSAANMKIKSQRLTLMCIIMSYCISINC